MKRFLLRNVALYTRNLLHPPPHPFLNNPNPNFISPLLPLSSISLSNFRLFSDEIGSDSTSNQTPDPVVVPVPEPTSVIEAAQVDLDSIEDVTNKDLKTQINKYFEGGDEELLPTILESILKRKLKGKHEDSDDEAVDELRMTPLDDVKDEEFESDFSEAYETDEDIENLYDARDIVEHQLVKDEYFNMDDKKWDAMVKDAIEHGHLKDTKECEEILEDMLMWENVIPDSIKRKIEKEYNKIAAMVATGELTHEQGLEIYQEFEDKMLEETAKLTGKDIAPQSDNAVPDKKKKKDLADPPGQGPILRWQTRVVFAPGGDAWHPKNRKVKLSVTVKELGLSKVQFRRLRELVGKRYHPGKDELTITSERFEHREENRKDCLRTLFSLIEEAGKARIMVEEARTSYIKNKLRAYWRTRVEKQAKHLNIDSNSTKFKEMIRFLWMPRLLEKIQRSSPSAPTNHPSPQFQTQTHRSLDHNHTNSSSELLADCSLDQFTQFPQVSQVISESPISQFYADDYDMYVDMESAAANVGKSII